MASSKSYIPQTFRSDIVIRDFALYESLFGLCPDVVSDGVDQIRNIRAQDKQFNFFVLRDGLSGGRIDVHQFIRERDAIGVGRLFVNVFVLLLRILPSRIAVFSNNTTFQNISIEPKGF